MNWVMGVFAGLLGLTLLLVVGLIVGGLLIAKGHVATRSVRYAAPPDTVWRLITDWAGHTSWRTNIRALDRLADRNGHEVWRETRSRNERMTSEVIGFDPSRRRMVTEVVDETAYGGTWTWQVEPDGAGSRLTIIEDGVVHNPIFRVVGKFFLDPRATMDRLHRDLKAKLGEPEPVFED